jgi:hypothetical protein
MQNHFSHPLAEYVVVTPRYSILLIITRLLGVYIRRGQSVELGVFSVVFLHRSTKDDLNVCKHRYPL